MSALFTQPRDLLDRFLFVDSELICVCGPRLVIGETFQHADNTITDEKQKSCTMLQARKLRTNIANLHRRQIAPDMSVCRHCEIREKTNTTEFSLTNRRVRQLLANYIELLTWLVEHHIKHGLLKWCEHGRAV